MAARRSAAALQFSPEAIHSQLVAPRQEIDEAGKSVFLMWYLDIANLLRQEGKEEKGHLEHTLHLIRDLHDLHLQLLRLPAGSITGRPGRGLNPNYRTCGP